MKDDLQILVVEDNTIDLLLLEQMFDEIGGFEKEICHSHLLSKAIEEIKKKSFHVILLNLSLPDSSGLDTFFRLNFHASHLPVLILSASDSTDLAREAVKSGAQDYLVKGTFDCKLLSKTIQYSIERKKNLDAITKSEEKYKYLFDNNPVPMWAYDVEDYSFIMVNHAAIHHYGYQENEFLTMKYHQICNGEPGGLFHAISGKKMEDRRSDCIHKRKDGRLIYAEVSTHDLTINNRAAKMVLAYDVTERKKAQEEVSFQASILQNVKDSVIVSDLNGKIIYWNRGAEEIFGYNEEEMKGKSVTLLNPAGVETDFRKLEAVKTERGFDGEWSARRKDGTFTWIHAHTTLMKDSSGKAIGFIGISKDVSEKKQAEEALQKSEKKYKEQFEQLQKANAELDRFVYSASHDLRGPLASILGLVSLAQMGTSDPQQLLYWEMMEKTGKKLDRFIYDIINYSKNTRVKVKNKRVNFNSLLADTIESLKYIKLTEKVELQVEWSEETDFYSDIDRLQTVFSNLISNAIIYSDPDKERPVISIEIKTDKEKAEIKIADNGTGIEEKNIKKIFNMFFRASSNSMGSGLGLYIVKEIVNKLKGSIQVESELNRGTTFYISLPNNGKKEKNKISIE